MLYNTSLYSDLIHWLETHMQPCFWKKNFGVDCMGCGMQRAIVELLKGNLVESIILYPALIPMIFVFLFLILHLIFKFKNGAGILKISFIFTVTIVFVNWLTKFLLK